jgi:4'-phosphopantetheinyl transferase
MPLLERKKLESGAELVLWNNEESADALDDLPVDWTRFENIKAPNKQREWVGRQLLFNEVGLLNAIEYLENGKPVLASGHISISHCDHLIGLVLSDEPIGLDIQNPNFKLKRIKEKFCSLDELSLLSLSTRPLEDLTRIWSTKEAVFKVYGERVIFADDLAVELVSDKEIECTVKNRDEAVYTLGCENKGEYFVIYTAKKRSL